jgi:hypothetical protein
VNFPRISGVLLAGCLAAAFSPLVLPSAHLFAQSGVPTQTVVTVMPKSGAQPTSIPESAVQASVGGKSAQIGSWIPLRGERSGLEIVVLIDSSARSGLSLQYGELRNFVERLPEGAEVGVAYMQNGRAIMAQNLTADRKLAAEAFRLTSGVPGESGSPYFCLSDLVKKWPSGNGQPDGNRREVIMITDGVDLYYGRGFDPNDPYVETAISDAQKAGVLVHSIFYRDTGRFDRSQWTEAGAQSYLLQVSDATGGRAYWQGFGNPVSFAPFLDDLQTRLQNQYELGILASPRNKTQLQPLKVKVNAPGVKVDAPKMVVVPGNESASR